VWCWSARTQFGWETGGRRTFCARSEEGCTENSWRWDRDLKSSVVARGWKRISFHGESASGEITRAKRRAPTWFASDGSFSRDDRGYVGAGDGAIAGRARPDVLHLESRKIHRRHCNA